MKLLFVYNAKSGRLNAAFDIAHKLLRPQTYQCSLCALTHDAFSEKQAWKAYRERSDDELEFYHSDEFEREFGQTFDYPVVLKQADTLEELLSASEIEAAGSVEALVERLENLPR